MKTITNILATACILFLVSCAGDSNDIKPESIPEPVKESFAAEYPGSKDVTWEKEGDYYEAEYEENGMEKSVVFDANGNVMATETEIAMAELPSAINAYINTNYKGYTIDEAEKEERTEGIFFEIGLENEDEEIELIFDSEGNFIKQELEEDEKEGDDKDEY